MSRIKNIFTDYNETFEPKYLEILTVYGLKARYKSIGDDANYEKLKQAEKTMLSTFLSKGSDAVFDDFIDIVLKGESPETIRKVIDEISDNPDKNLPLWLKAASAVYKRKGRCFTGEIDPDAVEVFKAAKERGLTTGIYSRSLVDLIDPYLTNTGMRELFDYVQANRLTVEDEKITGKTDDVPEKKLGLINYLISHDMDPEETAFIDNADMLPLVFVRKGIAAPTSKPKFKKICELSTGIKIETPYNWHEVGELLELW